MKHPILLTFCALALLLPLHASAAEPFRIRVVDAENGWPVPLVELKTTHGQRFFTDNAGVVAFDLPELMGRETWLHVAADGYEVKADGFGNRGFRCTPEPGGEHEVEVTRTIVAKRLGRLTGGGLFAESQKLGEHLDWKESGILGSDSIQTAVHRGKKFWGWGDTNVPKYPMGLFHMTGATTDVQPLPSFEPPVKLVLNYFRDEEGKVRNIANLAPDDPGPTWIGGTVSLPDKNGDARLVGCYGKIKPPLEAYRVGLCVWNDETANFESIAVLWEKSSGDPKPEPTPNGHPARWTDDEGVEWLLFGAPFPKMRVRASFEAWRDPDQWEKLTPEQETFTNAADPDGPAINPHGGSIAWNEFRQKWLTVFGQMEGDPTLLGEIWYAEADSPFGPWGPAVKVLSHREYTFYNVRIHEDLTPERSPVLLFEGTYTKLFSEVKNPTPRHDYNQILYRLDLDDPGLAPARGE